MEYEIYIESDGEVRPYPQPIRAQTSEEAIATAAGILRSRPGDRSVTVFHAGQAIATIESDL